MTLKYPTSRLTRFKNWYMRLWRPIPQKPPYKHICKIGDPVLRSKAQEVDRRSINSPDVQKIIKTMKKVMKKMEVVGLSAPQIGIPLRIIAVGFSKKTMKSYDYNPKAASTYEFVEFPLKIFINPTLNVLNNRKILFPECCASITGYSGIVPRFYEVKIKGWDETGEEMEWSAKGWPARIVQHEMDHLEGKFFTDVMDPQTFQYDKWYFENFNQIYRLFLQVKPSKTTDLN